ncbi:MAG TPA: hypothetical protein VGT08_18110 [Terracidiphilus sp.]|nr:hypothetical protein [Terracidiphilus sp.]
MANMTIEKAKQLIKGRFSYRLKKEFAYLGEIWQHGFSEVRVDDRQSLSRHKKCIAQKPVKAGLADSAGQYPHCFDYLAVRKADEG